jgi:hypothetical protein
MLDAAVAGGEHFQRCLKTRGGRCETGKMGGGGHSVRSGKSGSQESHQEVPILFPSAPPFCGAARALLK